MLSEQRPGNWMLSTLGAPSLPPFPGACFLWGRGFVMPPQRCHLPSVAASLCALSLSPRPPPRKALLLGLRHSGLWAELKALHAQTQELESVVERRQLLLRELQAKRQQILQWRQLVVRSWAW